MTFPGLLNSYLWVKPSGRVFHTAANIYEDLITSAAAIDLRLPAATLHGRRGTPAAA